MTTQERQEIDTELAQPHAYPNADTWRWLRSLRAEVTGLEAHIHQLQLDADERILASRALEAERDLHYVKREKAEAENAQLRADLAAMTQKRDELLDVVGDLIRTRVRVARIQQEFADDLADRDGNIYEQFKDFREQFYTEREPKTMTDDARMIIDAALHLEAAVRLAGPDGKNRITPACVYRDNGGYHGPADDVACVTWGQIRAMRDEMATLENELARARKGMVNE